LFCFHSHCFSYFRFYNKLEWEPFLQQWYSKLPRQFQLRDVLLLIYEREIQLQRLPDSPIVLLLVDETFKAQVPERVLELVRYQDRSFEDLPFAFMMVVSSLSAQRVKEEINRDRSSTSSSLCTVSDRPIQVCFPSSFSCLL
jgi:hypothetical protein